MVLTFRVLCLGSEWVSGRRLRAANPARRLQMRANSRIRRASAQILCAASCRTSARVGWFADSRIKPRILCVRIGSYPELEDVIDAPSCRGTGGRYCFFSLPNSIGTRASTHAQTSFLHEALFLCLKRTSLETQTE